VLRGQRNGSLRSLISISQTGLTSVSSSEFIVRIRKERRKRRICKKNRGKRLEATETENRKEKRGKMRPEIIRRMVDKEKDKTRRSRRKAEREREGGLRRNKTRNRWKGKRRAKKSR
jgi:hypothetical protein